MLQTHQFRQGDLVVYSLTKLSAHPGPRARSVFPTQMGEDYSYIVDKFWIVARVLENGRLLLVTRTGKLRELSASDPLLRKANWWQRIRCRDRFPDPKLLESVDAQPSLHSV